MDFELSSIEFELSC